MHQACRSSLHRGVDDCSVALALADQDGDQDTDQDTVTGLGRSGFQETPSHHQFTGERRVHYPHVESHPLARGQAATVETVRAESMS